MELPVVNTLLPLYCDYTIFLKHCCKAEGKTHQATYPGSTNVREAGRARETQPLRPGNLTELRPVTAGAQPNKGETD